MKRITGIIFLLSLFTLSINSQNVRASIQTSEVYLGQPFEYSIIIEGTAETKVPELREIDGFRIRYKGASTSMVSSFGMGGNNSSKTVVYSWFFTPLKKGILEIPSFAVNVNGNIFNTRVGRITVKVPEPIDGYHLIMETNKNEYWQGEPIIMTIKWLLNASGPRNLVFNIPFINSGLFTVEPQSPPQGSKVYNLDINGIEVLAAQGSEIYKGSQYISLTFGIKLIAETYGKQTLDPVILSFERVLRSNGFRNNYKSEIIPSNSIDLNIRKLPPEVYQNGKMAILSYGKLRVTTEASPLKVHIGDPLTYVITVEGAVSPEKTELPSLKMFGEMNDNFSIPDRRSSGTVTDNKAEFSQTIRVKKESVQFIPSIKIQYFNTMSGFIETVATEQIPIAVLPTEIVTSADLENTGYSLEKGSGKIEIITNEKGIINSFQIGQLLSKSNTNRETVLSSPIYWIFLLLPVVIFLILAVYRFRIILTEKFLQLTDNKNDFSRIYKNLVKTKYLQEKEVKHAIFDYLNFICNTQGKALTAVEYYEILKKKEINEEICSNIVSMLNSFDYNKYSQNKEQLDWNKILQEFYSYTMEISDK